MEHLQVGPLWVTLHRTVRVAPDKTSNLPPSLGHCKIYKVADFRETCPPEWEDNAVFVALHTKEALWMSFDRRSSGRYSPPTPLAVLVGAGGINALDGEKLGTKLAKDNYMVTPPQPWLDGWKDKDGTVYQFVCTEYKKGEGLTVGEQIMKQECKTGGIGIAVFEPKDPDKLTPKHKPSEWNSDQVEYSKGFCGSMPQYAGGGTLELCSSSNDDGGTCCDYDPMESEVKIAAPVRTRGRALRSSKAAEMGVGKGGKITQKIYPDPHGLEEWKEEPTAAVAIYLVNAEQFAEITGQTMPPLPKSVEDYYGKWFGLEDKNEGDVSGTDTFTGLKTVFAGDTANVAGVKEEK